MKERIRPGRFLFLILGACLGAGGSFSFGAEGEIVMEAYRVTPGRELMYNGKCALALGFISLDNEDRSRQIQDHTFDPRKVAVQEGYQEHIYSRTWEEAGFTYEANSRLYTRKIQHIISCKFNKVWEGSLHINPWIDPNLVLGARYKATDVEGLISEGIVTASVRKYVTIPQGNHLKELELWPLEGGRIKYRVENANPLPNPSKNFWAFNNLLLDVLSEDGKLKDARLNLRQMPSGGTFPAGYSNTIKVEVEFFDRVADEIRRPYAIASYTEEPPVIDGKLDDAVWQKAEKQVRFYSVEGPQAEFAVAYDKENIYLAVWCHEPEMEKVRKDTSHTRDDQVFQDNSLEFFVDPKASRQNYYQFIVNSSNVQLDSKRSKGKPADLTWNALKWRSATGINKDRWTLETAISFEDLQATFPRNEIWGFNLTRNRYLPLLVQWTKWADVKRNNYNVNLFGNLIFGKPEDVLAGFIKLTESDIAPIKAEIEKVVLDNLIGGVWAKKRLEALALREKEIQSKVEKASGAESKELFAAVHQIGEEYQDISDYLAAQAKEVSSTVFTNINLIDIKGERTLIPAKDFSRGNASLEKEGEYIGGAKDPKTNKPVPTWVDYNLNVEKSGAYLFRVKLAAGYSRPVKLSLDGRYLSNTALAQVTGGWEKADWFDQGALYLSAGQHTLRLEARMLISTIYALELVRKENLTPQQALSMKFNVYYEDELIREGAAIQSEVNCFPGDLVRIEVSCINESLKANTAKIALRSVEEKKDVTIWDVDIPAGDPNPVFIAQLRLPENLNAGLYQFHIPEGIEDFGLQRSAFKALPITIGPRPERPAELELELADEIDCTKDQDEKHPYAEFRKNKATVVEGPAGKYRLSGPFYSRNSSADVIPPNADSFGYKLTFKREDLGKPFMIVCDIPDDAMRVFTMDFLERCTPIYPPSPGVITGGKYPLSNKMVQLKFPCWPREEHPIIRFRTVLNGTGAACSRVRIYKIKSGYPFEKMNSKGRIMGTFWEEPLPPYFFGTFNPENVDEITNKGDLSFEFNRRKHCDAVGLLAGIRNYFEYKNYIGDNVIYFPVCYHNLQLYPSAILHRRPFSGVDDPYYFNDIMSVYFKMAKDYGIGIIMELVCHNDVSGPFSRPFIYALDKKYSPSVNLPVFQVNHKGEVVGYNPIHPEVQEFSLSLIRELMDLYADQPMLKGIALRTMPYYYPVPYVFCNLDGGYDDYTIEQFEKDTGIKISVGKEEGQARFSKRYQWLVSNAREEWLKWRCARMRDLYQRMAEIIRKKRPDMKLYLNEIETCVPDRLGPTENHLDSGFSWRDRMRGLGSDPLIYADDPNIVCVQPYMTGVGTHYRWKGWRLQFHEDLNLLPEIWEVFKGRNRTLGIYTDYYESGFRSAKWPRGYFCPDFWNVEIGSTISTVINPAGRNILGRYTVSMALGDCLRIFDGGNSTGTMGYEEYKREFARAYLALPDVPFEPYPKQSEPVFLRQKKHDGEVYFYLANAAPYECKVTLQIAGVKKDGLTDLSTGKAVAPKKITKGENIYDLSLKIYQFASYRLAGGAEIQSITTEAPREEITRLQTIEKEIEGILEKAKGVVKDGAEFQRAVETYQAGKAALGEKRYFEAQRQFENYKLDKIYQKFGYPDGLKYLRPKQDYLQLTAGAATN